MGSEKKIVKIVDARRRMMHDTRRMTDIQVITKAHPEHSSGELKIHQHDFVNLWVWATCNRK